jgi:hypothetical protein
VWALGLEGKAPPEVVDAPHQAFRCGAHVRVQGLPAVGRPREDAGGVPELARGGDLAGGRRPGMARSGACSGREAATTAGKSTERPSRRRAKPRETGPRRPRRRPTGPLLGLAEIRDWWPGDAAAARE